MTTSSAESAQTLERAREQSTRVEPQATRTEEVLRAFHEEGSLGKAFDLPLMARLWPFLARFQWFFWLCVGSITLGAGASLLRPLIMRHTIDHGVLKRDPHVLFLGGAVLASVVVLEQVLNFVQIYLFQVMGARAMAGMRRHVFQFLHGLKLGFFDVQPVGRLVTRVTSDVDTILELFASGAVGAIGDLIRLFGIVALMLALDWKLSLVAFFATPPIALLVVLVRQRSRDAFREIRAKTARMNASMNEQVSGLAVVQAFNRQAAAAAEFDQINLAYRDANMRSIKYESLQDAAIEMVSAMCLASIVVSLGYRPVSFGTVVAFNAYLLQFFEPISALGQRYTLLQSAMAGAERVFKLLDTQASDAPVKSSAPATDGGFAFSFENVSFSYKPGAPVLQQVSLNAKRGEKIALVGPTGAGKTTLASLLARWYDAEQGVVRVGGLDVCGMPQAELRGHFAFVPQDVFLFPGTVATNIAVGEEPDRDRVERVLRRIGAWDIFTRRSGGIDCAVEERGVNFSAGERQLIAFARALYRDAPILILDEATASVDSDTEARLQKALGELLKDRTALIIAHRLSTIRASDRILVMHKGRIVEQGTHEQLLAAGALYARLYELQFSRPDQPPPAASAPASQATVESSTRR